MRHRTLLKPLSWAYGGVLSLRNTLYNYRIFSSYNPIQRCISVGNLAVGGTGKTPAVEYLLRHLLTLGQPATGQLATLSRGYGRQTRGFRMATPTDTAATLGDEPLQLYQNFGPAVCVCVGEDRAAALQHLAQQHPQIKTVVLDDAYQHRAVQPHLNILLTDYAHPFYTDDPFPDGRLRERRAGASRADVILVTKCPQAPTLAQHADIAARIRPYTIHKQGFTNVPVLFAGLTYGEARHLTTGELAPVGGPVRLVSGLANAAPLVRYVADTWGLTHHHAFADHHAYTRAEVARLLAETPPHEWLLTTQKDAVKLAPLLTPTERQTRLVAVLPVQMCFFDPQDATTLARLMDTCLAGDNP